MKNKKIGLNNIVHFEREGNKAVHGQGEQLTAGSGRKEHKNLKEHGYETLKNEEYNGT